MMTSRDHFNKTGKNHNMVVINFKSHLLFFFCIFQKKLFYKLLGVWGKLYYSDALVWRYMDFPHLP